MQKQAPAEPRFSKLTPMVRAAITAFHARLCDFSSVGVHGLRSRAQPKIKSLGAVTYAVAKRLRSSILFRGSHAPKLAAAFILVGLALWAFHNAVVRKLDQASQTVRQGPPPLQLSALATGRPPLNVPRPAIKPAHLEILSAAGNGDVPLIDSLAVLSLLKEVGRDANGNMVVDSATLRLLNQAVPSFDGQADLTALAVIYQLIEAELPGLEGAKARDTFMRYLEYKAAEAALLRQVQAAQRPSAAAVLDKTSALRRRYFGSERAAQLFGEEEQHLRASIGQMAGAEPNPQRY